MFVITKLICSENRVLIISVFNSLNESIENLHEAVTIYKNNEEKYDVLIMNNKRIEIIERNPGWLTSGKSLKAVFQIVQHDGEYLKDVLQCNTIPLNIQESDSESSSEN